MNTSNYKNVTLLTDKTLLLIDAVKEHWSHVEHKFLHHLQIIVPLDNKCSPEDLNNLIRILCNSKQSINCLDNRTWWNSNFAGGAYIITIHQKTSESEIVAVYDLLCVSEIQDLDGIMVEMLRRLIRVFPKAQANICSSVELGLKNDFVKMVITAFGKISNPLLESEAFKLLDRDVKHWLLEAVGKDVRLLGMFYLMVHQPYNL